MTDLTLVLVAVFLPVFPLSIAFNALFARLRQPLLRLLLLIFWPLAGVVLYQVFEPQLPHWLAVPVLATSVFYAIRLLAMREVGGWTGYLATSIWSCMWLPLLYGGSEVMLHAIWFSVPLGILALLVGELEKRFGAAYTELYGGLAQTVPRFSGVFVVTVLAAVATPVFPAFFSMLTILVGSTPGVAITLLGVWGLWGWAGMRLIQGMIVGAPAEEPVADISPVVTWGYAGLMLVLVLVGVAVTEGL